MTAPLWQVYTAGSIGAQHVAMGKVNEDAVAVRQDDPAVVAVAVADGHGHARHFRSERGSALAVKVATELGAALAADVTDARASQVEDLLRERTGAELVRIWRAAVERDLADSPVTPGELHVAGLTAPSTDELVFAYGTTLILAVVAAGWLMCVQIGDGDVLAVTDTGTVLRPVPADPRLDGSRTTSLCQLDAPDAMRYGVRHLGRDAIAAVMLATDGYGNAQVRNDWDTAFGTDLAALAANHGGPWLGEQLPRWVRQCASNEGSADDVTVALVLAADARWRPARSAAAAERTTVVENNPTADATRLVDAALPVGGGAGAVDDDRTVLNVPPPGRTVVVGDDVTVPYVSRPPVADDTTVLGVGYPPVTSPPLTGYGMSPPPPMPVGPPVASLHQAGPPAAPHRVGTRETLLLVALAAVAAVGAVVLAVLLVR